MWWFIFLISLVTIVSARPQQQQQQQSPGNDVDSPKKITVLPFYGGAKGQSLQIVEYPDGKIETIIIKNANTSTDQPEISVNTSELENPLLPSIYELNDFGSNIKKIQDTAQKVVQLQERAKERGALSAPEEAQYKENMEILSMSAQNLASLQDEMPLFDLEGREGLSSWFERKASSSKDKKQKENEKKKREEEKKRKEEEERKRKEEEKRKQEEEEKKKKEEEKRKEEEEKEKEKESEKEEGDDDDAVEINLPQEDASVAEAKPIGLAVAGEGGVAASKPIATAVVGPGGLAIARPVGTAIAGVSPDDPLLPAFIEGYSGTKPKSGSISKSVDAYLTKIISKFHQN